MFVFVFGRRTRAGIKELTFPEAKDGNTNTDTDTNANPKQSDTMDEGVGVQPTGEQVDLHELSKGWKAAIARASDPATM